MHRRIAITGLGVVSPFGVGLSPLWEGLCSGASAVGKITRFDPSGFECRLAGEVKDFSAKDHVPKHYRKAVKVMSRDIELAVAAAKCAVEHAGLVTRASLGEEGEGATSYPPGRVGCHIGAGLVAAEVDELTSALVTATGPGGEFSSTQWGETGLSNLQPLWMLKYLPNMLACHVTIIHGAEGPSNTITCAEASGLLSVGESCRVIERDAADMCFSGSAESKVNPMGLMRMQLAGRVGNTGEAAAGPEACMPYDGSSVGVAGEAGGIVALEALDKARARGASVLAEVIGFGAAHSAWPPYTTAAAREGVRARQDRGLTFAIQRAIADAGIAPDEIDAIVPQASGSRLEDEGEAGTLRIVFGDRLASIPLVLLCPAIGNSFAGTGGVMVAVAAQALAQQRLPARLQGGRPAEGLLAGPAPSAPTRLRHVLVCGSSTGGQNAALVLRAPQ